MLKGQKVKDQHLWPPRVCSVLLRKEEESMRLPIWVVVYIHKRCYFYFFICEPSVLSLQRTYLRWLMKLKWKNGKEQSHIY